jgi:predicted alpha/beta hydrolase family esterase
MPHRVLFVQGGGEGAHDEWDSALVQCLEDQLGADYEVRYPRMPPEADPSYGRWKSALRDELAKLDSGAILIGHSIGGTILINAIADEPPAWMPGGILLIAAPFVGKCGWPSGDIAPMEDIGARLPAGVPIHLFHGTRDETAPLRHVDLHARAIPHAVVRRLAGRDHQLNDDMSEVAADVRQLE